MTDPVDLNAHRERRRREQQTTLRFIRHDPANPPGYPRTCDACGSQRIDSHPDMPHYFCPGSPEAIRWVIETPCTECGTPVLIYPAEDGDTATCGRCAGTPTARGSHPGPQDAA